jgi:putative DNA primase/helicase
VSDTLRAAIAAMAFKVPVYKSEQQPAIGPVLLDMSGVKARSVRWLWKHRFAFGRLSLLVGRSGLGKSFLTLDMAARITTGRAWPDGSPCEKGSVLLICCEDDPGDTIRPRLDAAGADPSKVMLLRGVNSIDPKTKEVREFPFTLGDVDAMECTLDTMPDCRLVVIDPIGSYLGGGTDSHRDSQVRGVLSPVATLAKKYNVAVVIVAHTRKSAAKYADDMALGSRAFTGIVRTTWHLMNDDDDHDRRLLLPGKNNLAKVAPGMAYTIESREPERDETARVVWEPDPVEMHADDALAIVNQAERRGPKPEKRNDAEEWLSDLLKNGLPRPVSEIKQEAKNAGLGCSDKTLGRALDNLGGKREQVGKVWQWRLPERQDSG